MEINEVIKLILISNGISIVLAICWVVASFFGIRRSEYQVIKNRSLEYQLERCEDSIDSLKNSVQSLENQLKTENA